MPCPTQSRQRVAGRSKIALGYGLVAGGYIVGSTLLLERLPVGRWAHAEVETVNGLGFVVVTSVALALFLYREHRAIVEARSKLGASTAALGRAHDAVSLSVVTGVIAHDMRNLLTAAIVNLEFVAPQVSGDEEAEQAFADIRKSLDRMSAFTAELMARTGKSGSFVPASELDLVGVVADCERLTSLFSRGHQCEFETSVEGDCTVLARRQELECAVLNLLLNAIDANEQAGKISITLTRNDKGVVMRVRDRGARRARGSQRKDLRAVLHDQGTAGQRRRPRGDARPDAFLRGRRSTIGSRTGRGVRAPAAVGRVKVSARRPPRRATPGAHRSAHRAPRAWQRHTGRLAAILAVALRSANAVTGSELSFVELVEHLQELELARPSARPAADRRGLGGQLLTLHSFFSARVRSVS